MFVKIFGVFLFIAGMLLIIFTEWFLDNFGRIEWAEAKLGGGTRSFLKILGLILIFVGLLMIFGLFGGLVLWIFSPLMPK